MGPNCVKDMARPDCKPQCKFHSKPKYGLQSTMSGFGEGQLTRTTKMFQMGHGTHHPLWGVYNSANQGSQAIPRGSQLSPCILLLLLRSLFLCQLQYTVQYATTQASTNNDDYCQPNLWNGYDTSDLNRPMGPNCNQRWWCTPRLQTLLKNLFWMSEPNMGYPLEKVVIWGPILREITLPMRFLSRFELWKCLIPFTLFWWEDGQTTKTGK